MAVRSARSNEQISRSSSRNQTITSQHQYVVATTAATKSSSRGVPSSSSSLQRARSPIGLVLPGTRRASTIPTSSLSSSSVTGTRTHRPASAPVTRPSIINGHTLAAASGVAVAVAAKSSSLSSSVRPSIGITQSVKRLPSQSSSARGSSLSSVTRALSPSSRERKPMVSSSSQPVMRSQSVKKIVPSRPSWGARPKVTLSPQPLSPRPLSSSSSVIHNGNGNGHRRQNSLPATTRSSSSRHLDAILGDIHDTLDLDDERIYTTGTSNGNGNGNGNNDRDGRHRSSSGTSSIASTSSSSSTISLSAQLAALPHVSDLPHINTITNGSSSSPRLVVDIPTTATAAAPASRTAKLFRERQHSVKRSPIMGAVVEERDEDLSTPRAPGRLSFDASIHGNGVMMNGVINGNNNGTLAMVDEATSLQLPMIIHTPNDTTSIIPATGMTMITTNALIMADAATSMNRATTPTSSQQQQQRRRHVDDDTVATAALARLSLISSSLNDVVTRSEKRVASSPARSIVHRQSMSDKKRPSSSSSSSSSSTTPVASATGVRRTHGHVRGSSYSGITIPSSSSSSSSSSSIVRAMSPPSRATSGTMPPSRSNSVKKVPLSSSVVSSSSPSIRSPQTSTKKRPSSIVNSTPPIVASTNEVPLSSLPSSSLSLSSLFNDDTPSSVSYNIVAPIVYGADQSTHISPSAPKSSSIASSTTKLVTSSSISASSTLPPSSSSSQSQQQHQHRHVRNRSVGGLMVTVGAHDVSRKPIGLSLLYHNHTSIAMNGISNDSNNSNSNTPLASPSQGSNSLSNRPEWGGHKIVAGAGHKRYGSGPLSQAVLASLGSKKPSSSSSSLSSSASTSAPWKHGTIIQQHTMSGAMAAMMAMQPAAITRAQTEEVARAAAKLEAIQRHRLRHSHRHDENDDDDDSSPDSSDIDSVVDDTSSIASDRMSVSSLSTITTHGTTTNGHPSMDHDKRERGIQRLKNRWDLEFEKKPQRMAATSLALLSSAASSTSSSLSSSVASSARHSRASSTSSTSSGFWNSPLLRQPELVAASFMASIAPLPPYPSSSSSSSSSSLSSSASTSTTSFPLTVVPPAGLSIIVSTSSSHDDVQPIDHDTARAVVLAARRASLSSSLPAAMITPADQTNNGSSQNTPKTASSTSSPRRGHHDWPKASDTTSTPSSLSSLSHASQVHHHGRDNSNGYRASHIPATPPSDSDSDSDTDDDNDRDEAADKVLLDIPTARTIAATTHKR